MTQQTERPPPHVCGCDLPGPNWRDFEDRTESRIRTTCRVCKRFIGYRPIEAEKPAPLADPKPKRRKK